MDKSAQILIEIVKNISPVLKEISDEVASQKPQPNKWSKKEILGHLIDSATNNHRRFVTANFKDDLIFEGYKQEEWVSTQNYQNRNWESLIDFWALFNFHISEVINQIPNEVKNRVFTNHSFDQMAWQTVPKSNPSSLDYFIKDYVGHLEHHIKQIIPNYKPKVIGTY